MSYEIKMPALSPTMTEGVLSKWLVKIGDEIRSGDIIAEIETDKATMEVEAIDDGIVTQLVIHEGTQSVPVGTVIATISNDDQNEQVDMSKNDTVSKEKTQVLQDEKVKSHFASTEKQPLEKKKLTPLLKSIGMVH